MPVSAAVIFSTPKMSARPLLAADFLPRLAIAGAALAALLAATLGWLAHRAVADANAATVAAAQTAESIEEARAHLMNAALALRDGLATGGDARWGEVEAAAAGTLRALEAARASGPAVEALAAPLARRIEEWLEFRELARLGRAEEAQRRIAEPDYIARTAEIGAAIARLAEEQRMAGAARARALETRTGGLLAGAGAAGALGFAALGLALAAGRRVRRTLDAERERLRVAFDAMTEGILFYGPDERVTLVNPRMVETFPALADILVPGTHVDDIVRRGFACGLYAGGDVEAYIAQRHAQRRAPGGRRELALADGRTILIHESPTPDGGRVLLYSDMTQEKTAERAKIDFVSTVSHELRTPLTSISGALALIGAGAAGEIGAKARQLIDIAGRNADRLGRLVDDLLQVQRLEAPTDDIVAVPVPLEKLLERATAEIAPMALKRGVRIALTGAVPPGARAMGDEMRLIQVLHNLLSNAVKFSPAGERVDLSARKIDGMWRISVADRGPGIPPAFRAHVFRRFAQADSGDTRARGGTGLGLSIAKAIVDKLEGRISFETEMGTGTTFTIELPAAADAAPAATEAPAAGRARA